jgi:hypothetical protein
MCVGSPDVIFAFPGFPAVACGALQQAGYEGTVPLSQCPFLPALVKDDCVCFSGSGTLPPTSAPVPTVPMEPPVSPVMSVAPETPTPGAPVSPTILTTSAPIPSSATGVGPFITTAAFYSTVSIVVLVLI